jgi:cytochrome o ubiquinol oxidase subunit 1
VILAALAGIAALVVRGFQRGTEKIIPAAEVRRAHQRWVQAARSAPPITRGKERTSANKGRAALETVGVPA